MRAREVRVPQRPPDVTPEIVPRDLTEDQLQAFAWKFLIPISLANILITAVFKVVF